MHIIMSVDMCIRSHR